MYLAHHSATKREKYLLDCVVPHRITTLTSLYSQRTACCIHSPSACKRQFVSKLSTYPFPRIHPCWGTFLAASSTTLTNSAGLPAIQFKDKVDSVKEVKIKNLQSLICDSSDTNIMYKFWLQMNIPNLTINIAISTSRSVESSRGRFWRPRTWSISYNGVSISIHITNYTVIVMINYRSEAQPAVMHMVCPHLLLERCSKGHESINRLRRANSGRAYPKRNQISTMPLQTCWILSYSAGNIYSGIYLSLWL